MGRRLIALLVVVASVTAACGGGDKKDDGPAKGGETTDSTMASGDTTTTTAVGGDGGAPVPGGATGGSAPATAGAPGSPTTTAKAGTAPAGTRTAAPGRYTYRRTGTRTVGGGDSSLDGEGTLTVDPANGNEQHSRTEYVDSSTEQTVRHRAGGIDLLFLKITFSSFTYEFRPSPPVLFAPDPPAVGATWSWRMTSTDGSVTVDGSFKVLRNETVTIGGEPVATAVVEGNLRFSGALTGTSKQTLWGSDRYRLIVRTEEAADFGFARWRSNSVLVSTKPG